MKKSPVWVMLICLGPLVAATAPAADPRSEEEEARNQERKFEFDQTLGTGAKIDPFGATPHEVVAGMIALAGVGKDDVVYDLGSGDGRIPIAAAKQAGARGVGIEFRPELVEKSRKAAEEAGVAKRVRFIQGDFFEADLSEATVVLLYLYPRTLLKLRPKLLEKLRPGARIVAYNYGIEDWPRDKEEPVEDFDYSDHGTFYYWVVPANFSGRWQGTITREAEGDIPFTLQLEQTFQQVRGQTRSGGRELPLEEIRVDGDEISFSLRLPGHEKNVHRVQGTIDGDQLKGQASRARAGKGNPSPMAWHAKRDPGTKTPIEPSKSD